MKAEAIAEEELEDLISILRQQEDEKISMEEIIDCPIINIDYVKILSNILYQIDSDIPDLDNSAKALAYYLIDKKTNVFIDLYLKKIKDHPLEKIILYCVTEDIIPKFKYGEFATNYDLAIDPVINNKKLCEESLEIKNLSIEINKLREKEEKKEISKTLYDVAREISAKLYFDVFDTLSDNPNKCKSKEKRVSVANEVIQDYSFASHSLNHMIIAEMMIPLFEGLEQRIPLTGGPFELKYLIGASIYRKLMDGKYVSKLDDYISEPSNSSKEIFVYSAILFQINLQDRILDRGDEL